MQFSSTIIAPSHKYSSKTIHGQTYQFRALSCRYASVIRWREQENLERELLDPKHRHPSLQLRTSRVCCLDLASTKGYLNFFTYLAWLSHLASMFLSWLHPGLYKIPASQTHWSQDIILSEHLVPPSGVPQMMISRGQ